MTETLQLSVEMVGVLALLAFTIYLFAFEVVRVDVAAIAVMVVIGLTSVIPGYAGLVQPEQLFSGYSSNAVISIIAIMIIGAGLDRTGVMSQLAGKILKLSGATEGRVIVFISSVVGILSSFMQNIGAAALFLPVVNRIARRGNLASSRLLMPMGFCAILGGTVTMVGSSPLILLNDLIENSNNTLPAGVQRMDTFGLFEVTPVGIALLLLGVCYFVFLGRFVLPVIKHKPGESGSMLKYFKEVYGIAGEVYECRVTRDSPLVGKTLSDVDAAGRAGWIVALRTGEEVRVAPRGDSEFMEGSEMAIMGRRQDVFDFAEEYALRIKNEMDVFAEVLSTTSAGIAEIVIMPDSAMIGKSIKDAEIRKKYGATVLAVFRADDVIDRDLSDLVMQSGDTLVVHIRWGELIPIADQRHDFAVVTDFPREDSRPEKLKYAGFFFFLTLYLVLFTDMRLSIALMTGAAGMILFGVIKIEEAYRAIGWQSVFLLASLIPLGVAMENSGTAEWMAQQMLLMLGGVPVWVLQAVLAVLATVFTLLMSNVGATVLLVPLAVNIAIGAGANPAVFALTVALATSNSFLIPTHQVNALIMGPGGYQVSDFLKAGSIITVMFLVVMIAMLTLFY
ncbi:MAG: SLC13 family permease [Gammaproteobacteria bacterium]|nr:SLC13 family permease [Gammaproteobacteria bacterium]MDD9856145.1 SLC13 family permease [Gammaproteobacteria bacterium]